MSRLLAVAARELRERWLLFPAALALGFVPFALPALGVKRDHAPVVGLAFAALFGVAAAVVIGSSMLARDSASGRLGFLFSRPVAWPTIWGGKWLAAVVLVAGCTVLAAVPWMVGYPHHSGSWFDAIGGDQLGVVAVLLVIAVGLANFNATVFRSRSPWLAADLLLLVVAVWAIRRYVAPLLLLGTFRTGHGLGGYLDIVWVFGGALLLASASQVALGRTDLRRAHRAMSATFWSIVGVCLLAAGVFLGWSLASGPADVRGGFTVRSDPSARWVWVEGSTGRGGLHHPGLLLDTAAGRYLAPRRDDVRVPWAAWGIAFSGDGRWAARWCDDGGSITAVERVDLQHPSRWGDRVALESSPPPNWHTRIVLSPSGGRVLLVHESGTSLFSMDGHRLATATIPPGLGLEAAQFLDEDRARVWLAPDPSSGGQAGSALVVTLVSDGSTASAPFALGAGAPRTPGLPRPVLTPAEGGRRLLSLDGALRLRDGATGELLATLHEGDTGRAIAMADGRIVLVAAEGTHALVRTYDRDGRAVASFAIPQVLRGLPWASEVPGGRIAVRVGLVSSAVETLVIDPGEGRVLERLVGLQPAFDGYWRGSEPDVAGRGVPPARFFWGEQGRLVRVDFATGERKVVLGPGAPEAERISGR